MATTLYIVVSGKGTRAEVDSYMYSTSEKVSEENFDNVREVCSIWRVTADNEDHANFLVKYQVGRLQSGLLVGSVFDTMKEAAEWYSVVKHRVFDLLS